MPARNPSKYCLVNKTPIYLERAPRRAGEAPALLDGSEQCDGCGEDFAASSYKPSRKAFVCGCGTEHRVQTI